MAPRTIALAVALLLVCSAAVAQDAAYTYTVVDTGQDVAYDDNRAITSPAVGEAFFGQDAHYTTNAPSYEDNGDGTVTDLNTGLMWQKMPDFDNELAWADAVGYAEGLTLGGYDDWRVPTIKELYSLIQFIGGSGPTAAESTPYIDTDYFDFEYPDEDSGERVIDVQYWSSTKYVGETMNGNATAFSVNFADGRIKGYPTLKGPGGKPKKCSVRCVRGATTYGVNAFAANDDGTVTDNATGLMWAQADSGDAMDWEAAMAYAEGAELAGYDDWRLPNAKELQSIVDYTRAPDAEDEDKQGPAIDLEFFEVSEAESYFWTGTTLLEGPGQGVYVAFGQAKGYWGDPMRGQPRVLMNVHGAGAQRGDPKSGDASDYEGGRGPQGDDVRIDNYVRLVRNVDPAEVEQVTPRKPTKDDNAMLGDGKGPKDEVPSAPANRPPHVVRPPKIERHPLPPARHAQPAGHRDDGHRQIPMGREKGQRTEPNQQW